MSQPPSIFQQCYTALLDECNVSPADRASEIAQLELIEQGMQGVPLDTLASGIRKVIDGALICGDEGHACIRSFLLSFTLMQKLKQERISQEGGV